MNSRKARPMSKKETSILVNLVDSFKIITSKATNATNNKLKEEAWAALTEEFNAEATTAKRTPAQLKFKWDNLKKQARKMAIKIHNDSLMTGGCPGGHFLPDECLEKVAAILGSSCPGLSVNPDEDAEDLQEFTMPEAEISITLDEADINFASTSSSIHSDEESHLNPSSFHATKTRKRPSRPDSSPVIMTKLNEEEQKSRIRRNNAVADYYKLKKFKLQKVLEQQNLFIKNLQLELENKKIENEKLKKIKNSE